ncbi:MAG: hypothetical protein KKA60_00755 [Proteobacteria bacterium]|nr:hypothetical protein [Pseudomonadota bacterium]
MNLQTAAVLALALVSTWGARRLGLEADMPTGLIGIAIIFPIVFSINSAYKRREEALKYLASFKAHAVAVFYAHRDWAPENSGACPEEINRVFHGLFAAVKAHFHQDGEDRGDSPAPVYEHFSRLSRANENLRKRGVTSGEICRINQYSRAMILEFERMRNILRYRTPKPLRAYSRVFLNTFPVLYGPYFALLAAEAYPFLGYLVAALYSVVLVSLDNIQDDLENPFDNQGEDDVDFSDVEATLACIGGGEAV